tara:strand:- start:16643 stop:17146 length:504 start_codon:yes stop_codon:yes gene_type:complete
MAKRLGTGLLKAQMGDIQSEINMKGATMVGVLEKVVAVTGAGSSSTVTLSSNDSGKVFLVNAADGTQTFTLPALTSGFYIEVIVTVLSDNDVVITAPGDNMIVSCRNFTASGAAAVHVTDTCTNLVMNADTANAVVGARVRVYCDGTNYVAIGDSSVASNSTFWVTS